MEVRRRSRKKERKKMLEEQKRGNSWKKVVFCGFC
jgi:hypothetical protein